MNDHHDTDLTDPHGEAEALRRENERLRKQRDAAETRYTRVCGMLDRTHARADAAEAALAAMTADRDKWSAESAENLRKLVAATLAPNPVANAGSCQPGALISRAAAICDKAAIERRQQAADGGDASQKERWIAGAIQAEILAKAIRAIPAAPVAEAKPPIGGAELDALVERLRKLARDMEKDATDDWDEHEDVAAAADAITSLRAQPDWKAMAERLGEAIKARKSARFASQVYEADGQIDAALSDLAKMKGE